MSFIHKHVEEVCEEYYDRFRRQAYVTPKTLLCFLTSYKILYKQKYDNIQEMAQRMSTGLHKLVEAAESVELLKIDLIEKNKEIEVANEAAGKVLKTVQESQAAAEVVKAQVAEIKEKAEVLVEQISKDKAVAEVKLEAAQPALEEAEAALRVCSHLIDSFLILI